MGFALNPIYAEPENQHLASPHEPGQAKKCVWEIFSESGEIASGNRLGSKCLSRKNAPTPTKHASGRTVWLSRDPIAENGGINLYAYTSNNPINRWDPDGLTDIRAPSGANVHTDLTGHGVDSNGVPRDPHIDYTDSKGRKTRLDLDLNDRETGKPFKFPKKDRRALERAVRNLKSRLDTIRKNTRCVPLQLLLSVPGAVDYLDSEGFESDLRILNDIREGASPQEAMTNELIRRGDPSVS